MPKFGSAMSFFPLVGALLLAGCGGGSESPTVLNGSGVSVGDPNAGGTAVPFETLRQDNLTGVEVRKNVVIKDADAWQKLWIAYTRYSNPPLPLPAVDFQTKMVVGVFIGLPPSSCYSTKIESIRRTADKLTVRYVETAPRAGTACAAVLTSPAHLVVTERSDLAVEFVKEAG
jgi:hypothetical protein